jgi:hypothetical protein
MDWRERKPDSVGPVEDTEDGFGAHVEMVVDDDGYFGRHCSSCEQYFKLKATEYNGLPDDFEAMCPYCGRRGDGSSFITEEQQARTLAAAAGLALQMVHQELNSSLSSTLGSSGSFTYTPGTPPPIEELPDYVEAITRREIECPGCANHYAVYGASAFCPICGPRPAIERVQGAIDRGRVTLAIEDQMEPDERETLRAAGVFDGFATEAIKQSVTSFEVLAEEQFEDRVADHASAVKERGKIFQRIDDVDDLFGGHAGFTLSGLVSEEAWARLQVLFAQRNVLTHNDGLIDQKYLDRARGSEFSVGQRLVIGRKEAEQRLDDLEALVQALVDHPA